MITYIFRRRTPIFFSIEKLFDALYLYVERSGTPIQRLELPFVSTGIVSVFRNAWVVLCRRRKGLIHITGDVHYAALLCPWAKSVVTIHDCVALQRGTGFKRLVMRLLWFSWPVRLASAVVVISEQTKRELLQNVTCPPRKLSVIPNFIDPAYEFDAREFAAERPRILHIGTTPNKNLPRVVEALRGIRCVLTIVGPLTESLRVSLRDNSIEFENAVSIDHDGMLRLYREADIISFPSTYEGFGMPILEGQAVGRPVLSSNLEPMRSVAGAAEGQPGALLVDPNSVAEIRRGFEALMSDAGLRRRLVEAGLENSRRYTLRAVAAQYRELYRRLQ